MTNRWIIVLFVYWYIANSILSGIEVMKAILLCEWCFIRLGSLLNRRLQISIEGEIYTIYWCWNIVRGGAGWVLAWCLDWCWAYAWICSLVIHERSIAITQSLFLGGRRFNQTFFGFPTPFLPGYSIFHVFPQLLALWIFFLAVRHVACCSKPILN